MKNKNKFIALLCSTLTITAALSFVVAANNQVKTNNLVKLDAVEKSFTFDKNVGQTWKESEEDLDSPRDVETGMSDPIYAELHAQANRSDFDMNNNFFLSSASVRGTNHILFWAGLNNVTKLICEFKVAWGGNIQAGYNIDITGSNYGSDRYTVNHTASNGSLAQMQPYTIEWETDNAATYQVINIDMDFTFEGSGYYDVFVKTIQVFWNC